MKQLFLRSQMSNGKMCQDCKMQKILSNRPLFYPLSFLKFLQAAESLGKGFYCMGLQAQVKRFWLRPVQPKHKGHFFQYPHQI
jgi:hypothetical protein